MPTGDDLSRVLTQSGGVQQPGIMRDAFLKQMRVMADSAIGSLVARQGRQDKGQPGADMVLDYGLVDGTEVTLAVDIDLVLFATPTGLVPCGTAGSVRCA